MAQEVDLRGLPDSVARGVMETIHNLKSKYGVSNFHNLPSQKMTPDEAERALEEALDTLPTMPNLPDKALRRESIYAHEDDDR